jgi:signal transduction histidine kinase/ActR/RegA family two-component response regulator
MTESSVFGVLICGRRQPNSFTSGECEFLRQLGEHVGLAAHQAQLYEALRTAYDDLRQSQDAVMQQERLRALGQMASGVAHDINNAITAATLYTESLLEQETNLSPGGREDLQTIQRAIEDVSHTVSQLGDFYRRREPALELQPIRLNDLLGQAVDLTRARWSDMPQHRGVVIRMQLDRAADLPVVMGVESEIREALINLVFNAVDAMPEGGVVVLRSKAGGPAADSGPVGLRHAILEVVDTGMGMDEATRSRSLEPFFSTKGDRGSGLGLAMVYGIAQRHSAEIEIDSEVGKGTTVRLVFPPADAPDVVDSTVTPVEVPRGLRVLVVDDDPVLLKTLRDILEQEGQVVETADGGQAGIDAFLAARARGAPFALVLTDLGMPHVDGRQVASAVKEVSPSTPVVMLTGWGQRLVAEGDIPPHVDRVLSKPPKLRQLREMLALGQPRGNE